MNSVARVRVFAVSAIAVFAIGCGGALVADDGGAGAGSGGSAGGAAGAGTGSGGAAGGAAGAAGAAESYTWAGGSITVAPTSAVADNLIVIIDDQASPPALSGMLEFAPTTTWNPTNGAGVSALYTCGSPSLAQIQLVSCANQLNLDRAAMAPGCLVAVFTAGGTIGSFIHPNGSTCNITAAKAILQVPPPTPGVPSRDAAVGTYEFNCEGADGTHLLLSGHFLLPVASWQLAC